MTSRFTFAVPAVALVSSIALAQSADKNWPAWRGPLATGVAPQADPPTEWSDSKNMRWKVAIPGRGHATPIVWGDRIYVLSAVKTDRTAAMGDGPDLDVAAGIETGALPAAALFAQDPQPQNPPDGERPRRPRGEGGGQDRPGGGRGGRGAEKPTHIHKFVVLCLDRKTGKTLWEKTVKEVVPHAGTHPDGTQASGSPITDGTLLYAFFGSAGLYCLDLDGNVKWEKELGKMRTRNNFGEGASPALHGDTLVVNWDHEEDDFIAAFDKKTGKELWRKTRDESTTWCTPLIVEVGGKPQVIISATKQCRAYDLKTGDTVWECKGLTDNVIPTPVHADGIVYLISGFRGAALKAVKLSEAKGDITDNKSAIIWSTSAEKTPYVPSPLLYGDYLYFFDNNKAVITCLNAKTGEKSYGQERIEGMQGIYASPVAASGRIYVAGRDGKVAVIKAGPKFEIIAQNTLDDGFDATPAIAGNELFLRGKEHLYCIAKN
jgi:outer membrane protein assembly factor BamB